MTWSFISVSGGTPGIVVERRTISSQQFVTKPPPNGCSQAASCGICDFGVATEKRDFFGRDDICHSLTGHCSFPLEQSEAGEGTGNDDRNQRDHPTTTDSSQNP